MTCERNLSPRLTPNSSHFAQVWCRNSLVSKSAPPQILRAQEAEHHKAHRDSGPEVERTKGQPEANS